LAGGCGRIHRSALAGGRRIWKAEKSVSARNTNPFYGATFRNDRNILGLRECVILRTEGGSANREQPGNYERKEFFRDFLPGPQKGLRRKGVTFRVTLHGPRERMPGYRRRGVLRSDPGSEPAGLMDGPEEPGE